ETATLVGVPPEAARRDDAATGQAVAAVSVAFLMIWRFRRRARGDSSPSPALTRKASSPPRCSTERSAWALIRIRTRWPSASLISVTWHRLGRNRRFALLLAWLTLLPTSTALPVSSHRRDIAFVLFDRQKTAARRDRQRFATVEAGKS